MNASGAHKKPTVLYVDDDENACLRFANSAEESCHVLTASSVHVAIALLREQHDNIDILITDYCMPSEHGGELIWEASVKYPRIVRILVTAFMTEEVLMETVNYGGVFKVLKKPLDRIKIQTVLEAASQRAKENRAAEQMVRLSYRDPLTDLFNRRYFDAELVNVIAEAQRTKTHAGLLMVDLDHFKKINDTYSHQAGDEVLMALAKTLEEATRTNERCFRLGGDEFAILVSNANEEQMTGMAERIGKRLNALEFHFKNDVVKITASLGIAIFPSHARNKEAMLECADAALYLAKKKGKNCWAVFGGSEKEEIDIGKPLDIDCWLAIDESMLLDQKMINDIQAEMQGKDALFNKFFEVFFKNTLIKFEELETACQTKDITASNALLHHLKGTSDSTGAHRMMLMAKRIHQFTYQGQWPNLENWLDKLKQVYRETQRTIEDHVLIKTIKRP